MNGVSKSIAFMLCVLVMTILCSVIYVNDQRHIQQVMNKQHLA